MCSIIFSATYVIFTFIAMPMYTKVEFCTVIRMGCIIMLTGCWCRSLCYFTGDFWPVLLGSTWLSCAYPIFLSAVGLVVVRWFPDHQRALATTVCGLALPCGNLVAFTMTGVTFASTDPNDYPQVVDSLDTLLLEQNIINTILCVGFFIFVRNQPDKPPSLAAL
jgi:hypothetical protein